MTDDFGLSDGPLPVLVLLLQGSGPCVHAENSLSPCTLQLPKGLAYVVTNKSHAPVVACMTRACSSLHQLLFSLYSLHSQKG